jgi:hypothetical protein
LNAERTNETRVLDAIEGTDYREGDKIYVFFKTPEELCLREKFDGTYDTDILLDKLHSTLEIFDTILDVELFPNFSLKRNRDLLGDLPALSTPAPKKKTTQVILKKASEIETVKPSQSKAEFPSGFWQTR